MFRDLKAMYEAFVKHEKAKQGGQLEESRENLTRAYCIQNRLMMDGHGTIAEVVENAAKQGEIINWDEYITPKKYQKRVDDLQKKYGNN